MPPNVEKHSGKVLPVSLFSHSFVLLVRSVSLTKVHVIFLPLFTCINSNLGGKISSTNVLYDSQ